MENEAELLRYNRFGYKLSVTVNSVFIFIGVFTFLSMLIIPSWGEALGLVTQKSEYADTMNNPFKVFATAFSHIMDSFIDFLFMLFFGISPLLIGLRCLIDDIITKRLRLDTDDSEGNYRKIAALNNTNLGMVIAYIILTHAFAKEGYFFAAVTVINVIMAVFLVIVIIKRPKLPKTEINDEAELSENEDEGCEI